MYKHILVPVDLHHKDAMGKALTAASDLGKHYGADIHLVSVTASAASEIAHTPEEYQEKLEAFAKEQGDKLGANLDAKTIVAPDPVRDLERVIEEQIDEQNIDLVVMASHVPHFGDYLIQSNAGNVAAHTDTSIFIVR